MIPVGLLAIVVAIIVFLAIRSPRTLLALVVAVMAGALVVWLAAGQDMITLRPELRRWLGIVDPVPPADIEPIELVQDSMDDNPALARDRLEDAIMVPPGQESEPKDLSEVQPEPFDPIKARKVERDKARDDELNLRRTRARSRRN